jgi:hypothetical protein
MPLHVLGTRHCFPCHIVDQFFNVIMWRFSTGLTRCCRDHVPPRRRQVKSIDENMWSCKHARSFGGRIKHPFTELPLYSAGVSWCIVAYRGVRHSVPREWQTIMSDPCQIVIARTSMFSPAHSPPLCDSHPSTSLLYRLQSVCFLPTLPSSDLVLFLNPHSQTGCCGISVIPAARVQVQLQYCRDAIETQ